MRKPMAYVLALMVTAVSLLFSSCEKIEEGQPAKESESRQTGTSYTPQPAETDEAAQKPSETLSAAASPGPAATPTPDIVLHYEAEEASLKGLDIFASGENGISAAGGGSYVGTFGGKNNKLTFHMDVAQDGEYELIFYTAATEGESYNNVTVNGKIFEESLYTSGNEFKPFSLYARLTKGENEIIVSAAWGGIYVDYLEVKSFRGIENSVYDVPKALVNKNASENTKRQMSYLADIYGNYTLFGAYNYDTGVHSAEIEKLYELTGKYPSVMGFDFMDYSPSRVERGAETMQVEYAIEWGEMGGIVTIIWHWNAPKDLVDSSGQPWFRGFYTEATEFDLDKALNGEDDEGYKLLQRDIDAIAEKLKLLAEKDIPVLWRPLHEASGGWFWWGAYGEENYKKLWIMMYDRLTYMHGLNNLIWVNNCQNHDWYPGDKYVDIIAEDVYVEPHDYDSQYNLFEKALGYSETNKLIALAEVGVIPDPDLMRSDNSRWLFFALWNDVFVLNSLRSRLSDEYNDFDHIKYVMNDEWIVTFDELPDLEEYPID